MTHHVIHINCELIKLCFIATQRTTILSILENIPFILLQIRCRQAHNVSRIVQYNDTHTTTKIRRKHNKTDVFENFNETNAIIKTRIEWHNIKSSILILRNGYKKHENGTCTPTCDFDCINGYCSAPNQCECNDGYSKPIINGYVI